jgi:hypothetical protein
VMRCGVIENSIEVKHVINRLPTCRGCLLEAGNNACVSEDVAHNVCLSDTHRLTFWARESVGAWVCHPAYFRGAKGAEQSNQVQA